MLGRWLRLPLGEGVSSELTHDHIRDANTASLGKVKGQLLVVHLLIEAAAIAVEDWVTGTGLTHLLEHHLQKHGFELFGDFLEGGIAILPGFAFQLGQMGEISIDIGRGTHNFR